jgi:hypothetical protein
MGIRVVRPGEGDQALAGPIGARIIEDGSHTGAHDRFRPDVLQRRIEGDLLERLDPAARCLPSPNAQSVCDRGAVSRGDRRQGKVGGFSARGGLATTQRVLGIEHANVSWQLRLEV